MPMRIVGKNLPKAIIDEAAGNSAHIMPAELFALREKLIGEVMLFEKHIDTAIKEWDEAIEKYKQQCGVITNLAPPEGG